MAGFERDAAGWAPTGPLRLRPEALAWRPIDGEIIALEVESSTYVATNRTGAFLWQLLAEGTTVEELARRLAERYGLDEAQARADVTDFVAAVAARGLLEPQCSSSHR